MATRLLPRNMSMLDRWLRLVVGVAVLTLAFTGPRTAWGYLGLIPLVTGLVGTCPLYALLGISTCSIKGRRGLQA